MGHSGYTVGSRADLSAVGGDKAAAGSQSDSAAPAHFFPQLQTQINPALNQNVLIRMMWYIDGVMHTRGKQSSTSVQACAGQEAVGPSQGLGGGHILTSPYPDGSLVLCCSSHARPSLVISHTPKTKRVHPRSTVMSHLDKLLRSLLSKV